jgi:hypothetical protein
MPAWNDPLMIGLIGLAIIVAFVVLLVAIRWSRRRKLRQHFGPEYQHTVEVTGDRREAEKELERRQKQHEKLALREISAERKRDFRARWRRVQGDFVDNPREALIAADELVTEVLRERGYPVEDFRRRYDEVSVEHPEVAADYRRASEIGERDAAGEATTEELREAMVCYRRLFDSVVGPGEPTRNRPATDRNRQEMLR